MALGIHKHLLQEEEDVLNDTCPDVVQRIIDMLPEVLEKPLDLLRVVLVQDPQVVNRLEL